MRVCEVGKYYRLELKLNLSRVLIRKCTGVKDDSLYFENGISLIAEEAMSGWNIREATELERTLA